MVYEINWYVIGAMGVSALMWAGIISLAIALT
jgi:hypothetical protein